MTPPYPLIAVSWADAHSPAATDVIDATQLTDDLHGTMTIVTVGWELRSDTKGIMLAGEFCGGTEFRGLTFIPRALVLERLELGQKKPPRRRRIQVSETAP